MAYAYEEKLTQIPVFVQHPDGSISQGFPPGFEDITPPDTPTRLGPGLDLTALQSDIVKVMARHELLFLALMLIHFIVRAAFDSLELKYWEDAITELTLIYPDLPKASIVSLYWTACAAESAYSLAFCALGVAATFLAKPAVFQRFALVAIIGTVGQLPLAYLNLFNLLIFLLRFISYTYARFMANLLVQIDALRDSRLAVLLKLL